jgi:hypothetical protein
MWQPSKLLRSAFSQKARPIKIAKVATSPAKEPRAEVHLCTGAVGLFLPKSVVSDPVIPKGGEAHVVWQARRVSFGNVLRRAAGALDAAPS